MPMSLPDTRLKSPSAICSQPPVHPSRQCGCSRQLAFFPNSCLRSPISKEKPTNARSAGRIRGQAPSLDKHLGRERDHDAPASNSSISSFPVHRNLDIHRQAVGHDREPLSIPPRQMGRPRAQAQGPLGGFAPALRLVAALRASHPHHGVSFWCIRCWLHRQHGFNGPRVAHGAGLGMQYQRQYQSEYWRADLSRPRPTLLRCNADFPQAWRTMVLQ